MMRIKRNGPLLAAAAGIAVLASGCAMGGAPSADGGAPETVSESSSGELDGTVVVWSWDTGAQALERLGAKFEQQHPGVQVKVTDVGYDNAYDKVSVGLQAGSGLPDVVTMESEQMATYTARFPTGFVDLAPAAEAYESDVDPSKWAASSDDEGHLFSMPWDSAPVGIFYRRDLFAQAGVDPESIETWDDYVAAGEKIKADTGEAMLIADVTGGDPLLPMLMQQLEQSYFTEDGEVAVDDDAAHEALALMETMQSKGLIVNAKGWDGLVSATKEGRAAAQPTAVWWAGSLVGDMPELDGKYGVMPLPTFDGTGATTSNIGGSSLAVPSQSDNQQAAWEFIRFALLDKENQTSMMENEGLFPSYLPALDDPYFDQPQPYFGGQSAYAMFADLVGRIPSIPYSDDDAKASEVMDDAVAAVLLGDEDLDAALESAAGQIASATGRETAD